ncbi:MAG: YdeI/OmpD-associated family protein [Candidatus Latescibacterota bacterium]|nr:MAG: YdeI/OmpD-associated family protein [Candidatus Latescibacterota bacterium]
MIRDNPPLIFADRAEWREWLVCFHDKAVGAWLVFTKKSVRKDAFAVGEAVEEALCFGWIDGKLRSRDAKTYTVRFTPRRTGSIWSISNIRRVNKLTRQGKMTPVGMDKVAEARRNGQWDAAIQREKTDVIPPDLASALRRVKGAIAAYRHLPDTRKKQYLYWLNAAKKPETRQKRIHAIVGDVTGRSTGTR